MRAGTSGELTSDLPGTGPRASATLTVVSRGTPIEPEPLGFSKAFSPATVETGGISRLTYTIDNTANGIAVGSLAFTDDFPAGLAVASTPNAVTDCFVAFATAGAATSLAFSGGSVAVGQSCTIALDVQALQAGTLTGTSGDLTSDLPDATPGASATLTVVPPAAAAPGFAKAFSPDRINPGEISTLTYTIDNTANAIAVGSLAFTDAFPAGLAVAPTPNAATTCGGTFAPAEAATSLVFSGGSVAAGQSCTIAVDVQALQVGTLTGTSGDLTSDLPDDAPGASATLTVNETPLSVSMSFSPSTIDQGGVSRLTYVLRNEAPFPATSVSLSDTLPTGVVLASEPNAQSRCVDGSTGPLTAPAGGGEVSWSAVIIEANGDNCTVAVDVTSAVPGSYRNATDSVTSSLGASPPVEATLTVDAAEAPGFAKAFSPDRINPGEISTLTYTIDNTANLIDVGGLAFTDAFPAGLAVAPTPNAATTCGGTFAPAEAATSLVFSGGSVAAGQSCTIAVDVQALQVGTLTGTSGDLTSDLPDDAPGASATLTVNETPLSVSMSFSPSTIDQGGVSRLTYVLRNEAPFPATSVSLSDTLPTGVVLASEPNAQSRCVDGSTGPLTAPAGGGEVSWSAVIIEANGDNCTVAVDVTSAVPGSYRNATDSVTSSLGASPPVEATLTVEPPADAEAPGFAKVFSPATIDPGGVSTLTFTIDNAANPFDVGGLAFGDDFPDGLAVAATPNASTTCGGTFAPAASATSLVFSGGSVGDGASCTVSVNVQALHAGTLANLSDVLTSDLPDDAPGAAATLTVNEAPLSVSMTFSPATVDQGRVSRLSYGLDNDATVAATSVSLSDTLPTGVVLANPPNLQTTCPGGRLEVASSSGVDGRVSWSGGELGAGASCTIAVDVTSAIAGSYPNSTDSVTSSLGASAAAEAMLTVTPAGAPGFARVFSPDTIRQGGETQVVFTVDNGANAIAMTEMAFDDSLPSGVSVADTPGVVNGCGGTFSPVAGATTLGFSGGTLAAGAACEIRVSVRAIEAGTLTGPEVELTSSIATATAAEATLTVTPAGAPGFAKAFSPPTVDPGGVSTLSFTIDNGANAIAVGSLAFDDAFPDGMVVALTPNADNSCGGTFAPVASATSLAFSGGSVGDGASCTLSVDVQALQVGTLSNLSGVLTSDLPDDAPGAAATLTVNDAPLSVSVAFSPATVDQGGVSRLSYGLDNGAALAATSVSLSDTLPGDVVLASDPDAQTTCTGGTLTAQGGGSTITFTGGELGAGASCTIAVDVTSTVAGSYPNATDSVTSSLGASAPAEATLTVTPAGAPGFAKAFSPDRTNPGVVSTLTYTIDNTANLIDVGGLAFDDAFPAGLAVASTPNASTTCGGTFAPAASATSLAFTGGSVAAGQSCTLSVDVEALQAGALTGTSGVLTSDLPDDAPGASATLTVDETPLSVSVSFSPSTIDQGGVSRLSYGLDNGAAVGAMAVALSDTLPGDVVLASDPDAQTTCTGGTLTAQGGGNTITFTGGALGAGASCTIAVDVTSTVAGSYPNATDSVTSSLGASAPAEDTLTVDAAGAPGFARVFSPDTIPQGGETQVVFTIDNGANAIAMTEMAFDDSLPSGVSVADTPGAVNGCGGTFSPVAGATTLGFSDGTLAAGAACEIRVRVRAIGAGTLTGPEVALTSNIATATAAEATLTVTPADAPGFAKAFSPATVGQGEVSRLTFTIDNAANAIAVGSLAFTDDFPDGMVVASAPRPANNDCGGTVSVPTGGTTLSLSGGDVAAGGTCTLFVDVQALRAGTLENVSGDLTSDLPVATPGALATLTVDAADAPGFARVFSPDTIPQGGETQVVFTIDNGANAIAMTEMAFDDSLPSGVSVADTPGAVNGCGGTFSPVAGATTLGFSDGVLAAGAACEIRVSVRAIGAGTLTGPEVALTSSIATATAAEATLTVTAADAPGFAKTFSPPTVDPGGVSRLTFTIDNAANAIAVGSLAFTDAFPDGMVVASAPRPANNDCGGTVSVPTGGTTLSLSGGDVAAGGTCTLFVDVQALRAGTLENVSGDLTSDLPVATPGALATLTVNEAPLSVSMAFEPTAIRAGGVSRLTYELDNGTALAATLVDLSDTLPDDVVLADPPDAQTTCAGGTLTAQGGGTSFEYSDGSLGAGGTCTIAVDVTSAVAGSYRNDTVSVTSSLGASAAASATLTVNAADAPGFARVFSPDTIPQGEETQVVFTIDNGANVIGMTEMAFDDSLPSGVSVADTPGAVNSCGGTFSPVAGATTLGFSDGTLAAGAACEIRVTVRAIGAGTLSGPAVELTSSIATATAAEATLTVEPADAPVFSKAFSPATVAPGGVSRLTFTIDNTANAIEVGSLAFDDAFPDGMHVAGTPNAVTTCGGTLTTVAAFPVVMQRGGAVAAGQSCTISVDVRASRAGTLENVSGELISDLPDDAPGASATLTVTEAPLSVSMSFEPATVDQGGVSRLSYGLDNGAAVGATAVALSDTLPGDVVLASDPDARTTCTGGTLTAQGGGNTITFSGGELGAGASCTIAVDVTSTVAGSYPNATQSVTSSLGASAPAEATLTVDAAGALGFAKTFSPATVAPGGVSRLSFTIDNVANAIAVGSLAFDDAFPDGMVVAATPNADNSCGGTFAPVASATSLAFSGGSVGDGASCTLSVDVQALHAGTLSNLSGVLTSDLPVDAPGAAATLTVTDAPLSVSVAFSPATVDQGGVSRLSYGLDNGAAVGATSVSLSDTLPGDVVLASDPDARTTCTGGTLTAQGGGNTITFTGGSLDAGAGCTIAVDVTSAVAGSYPNATDSVTSSLGASAPAEATLTVDAAAALGFAKVFSPATVDPGGISRLTFTIDNTANLIDVGGLAFDDDFPEDLAVAVPPNASTTCGGTFAPAASATSLAFTGGLVGAGQSCTLSVDVRASRAIALTGTSGDLASDLPVATPGASATLMVNEAPLSVSMSFQPTAIRAGGVSRLTYELRNEAAVGASLILLSDTLPADVVVADPPNAQTTCTGGVLAAVAGGREVSYSDDGEVGLLSSSSACTIAVDVTSTVAGSYSNDTESVISSLGASAAAEATLTVTPAGAPGFARVFSPDTIEQGGETQVVFTIDNGANAIAMTGMAFDDSLPSGVSVADTPGAVNGCGGTFSPVAGATTLGFSGGVLAAGATCEIRVRVRAIEAGTLIGPQVALTSSIATATAAEATLTVTAGRVRRASPRRFRPTTVDPGGVSTAELHDRQCGER